MTQSELEDWAETHFDVTIMVDDMATYDDGYLADVLNTSGRGGLQQAAFDITNKFQRLHNDTCWGIDAEYMEELENFINNYSG